LTFQAISCCRSGWLGLKYRGEEPIVVVVNGRHRVFQGERPYSTVKITFAVILGLIVRRDRRIFYVALAKNDPDR